VTENQNKPLFQVKGQEKDSSFIGHRRKNDEYKRKVSDNIPHDKKICEITRFLIIKDATIEEIRKFFTKEHNLSTTSDEIKNILYEMIEMDWVDKVDYGKRTHIYRLTVKGVEAHTDVNRIKASSPLRDLKTFSLDLTSSFSAETLNFRYPRESILID
jgi:hypothetical protein